MLIVRRCSRSSIGYLSLRRSGIYFSILTLAFAQMCYNLAYSVLTPITNGETGAAARRAATRALIDLAVRRRAAPASPTANLFGMPMSGYGGFYFCAVLLIVALLHRACASSRSPFGMMLRAIKSNQNAA